MRTLEKILTVKPEPETTPMLSDIIQAEKAIGTVSEYLFTPSLRAHCKRIFDCVVNRKGQGFWVQAEYGAGKTHFLGALVDLLVWRDLKVWDALRDQELRSEYAGALSKARWFPVPFSLRGMGQSGEGDSLMRVFEEQIRESLKTFAPDLESQIKITSAELADHWYDKEATDAEKAGVKFFFEKEHKCSPEEFRTKSGPKKFGQELVRSKLPEGRLRGKFKERFAHIYDQITKLGNYDGIVFVVDEFRSWQDRHPAGTPEYAEDEEVLETLAYVLPTQHLNIITIIASQGDMPQKLSGGGEGDRFLPLYLLADKNKGDFGEIVTFRCRELLKGATTDIKDYYDYCRKEYKFVKQANISQEYFAAIFPFQPRCFDVMRRLTQNAEKHNLPTARSAIRMAWQSLSDAKLLKGKRLIVLPDIIKTDELQKGLNHEHYKDAYLNLQASTEQLAELELDTEERDQCEAILQTLLLWVLSLPDNQRDGLTAQEVAEAAWLHDDAVGATAQAESILELLLSHGFPVRKEKKTRAHEEVAVYSYETSAVQANPVKYFAPLKKKFLSDKKRQDDKWIESLFWQLPDITPDAQAELGVNGGLFAAFAPNDQRTVQEKQNNTPPRYQFPHRPAASTRKLYKVAYGGEIVVSDRWRDEFGDDIKNTDQHFRIVCLVTKPTDTDAKITGALKEARVAVCRSEDPSDSTRDALADLLAAEEMKRTCAAPNQASLRDYADGKRRDAVKALLKCQQDEFRRGQILTQKGYGIKAVEVFATPKEREESLAGRLLEKSYDTPLFSPKELKKEFTETDARKVFAGLFTREPATAEKDAVINFGGGLELTLKSHPSELKPDASQALAEIRKQLSGVSDRPISDIQKALCRPPYGLTQEMVNLYLFTLVKLGGYELALNPAAQIQLSSGKPLPANKLTAHTLGLCKWNSQMDKALLGARIVASVQKGWNEVLPYARMLDDSLKPASTPDEELQRNEQLLAVLAKLKDETPLVAHSLKTLAEKLAGAVPKSFTELIARLNILAATTSYQEFDAAVRESYATPEKFKDAFTDYDKARKLRDRAFEISQARDYLAAVCDVDSAVEMERQTHLGLFKFDSLLTSPHVIPARLDSFEKWKGAYIQAYRKAHRAFYESLEWISASAQTLRPRLIALSRLSAITELGPPLTGPANLSAELDRLESTAWVCPDAAEAEVAGTNAICPKCSWTPAKVLPQRECEHLSQLITQGLADRIQRLKDASIAAILRKAADESNRADLKSLLEIIQVADADKLVGVITDDLVTFLRKLLQDANIVHETVALQPILNQIGAVEEERIEESLSKLTSLLRTAIKNAKAKHGAGKRVRVLFRLDDESNP
jgi:hypothetical protein